MATKRERLLKQIADAKERRLRAIERGEGAASTAAVVADIEAEIADLRARQRAEYPEDFASKDTDEELLALREQQVRELTAQHAYLEAMGGDPRLLDDIKKRRAGFLMHWESLRERGK